MPTRETDSHGLGAAVKEVAEHASHCRIHGTGPRACKGLPPGAEPWQDGA